MTTNNMQIAYENNFIDLIAFEKKVVPNVKLWKNKEKSEKIVIIIKKIMLKYSEVDLVKIFSLIGVFNKGYPCVNCLELMLCDFKNEKCESCNRKYVGSRWDMIKKSREEWFSNFERGINFINECIFLIKKSEGDLSETFVGGNYSDDENNDNDDENNDNNFTSTTTATTMNVVEPDKKSTTTIGWLLSFFV